MSKSIGFASIVDDVVRYCDEVQGVHPSKPLDWLLRIIDRIDKKDDVADLAKFFLTELLVATTSSGTFSRDAMLQWKCYSLVYDRLQRTCQVALVDPFLDHLDTYRRDIRAYETRTRDDRAKKRRVNAASSVAASLVSSSKKNEKKMMDDIMITQKTELSTTAVSSASALNENDDSNTSSSSPSSISEPSPPSELIAKARVRFTISSANIMPTKKTEHRYTKQPSITSGAMCDGKTYSILHKLPPIPQPAMHYGNFDYNNHAFLVTSEESRLKDTSYAGKRITISKMSNIEFALLAMQVLAGRTKCDVADEHKDKTFLYMLDIFSKNQHNKRQVDCAIPAPSAMTRSQKCELIFAYLYLYVLDPAEALPDHFKKEVVATASSGDTTNIEQRLQSIQSFYLHCGARITTTKYSGWIQNPRRFGHK